MLIDENNSGLIDLINMTPPEKKIVKVIVPEAERKFTLMTRNTGALVRLDEADFEILRFVAIYEKNGHIVLRSGETISSYLGIRGTHKTKPDKYDHRRERYVV